MSNLLNFPNIVEYNRTVENQLSFEEIQKGLDQLQIILKEVNQPKLYFQVVDFKAIKNAKLIEETLYEASKLSRVTFEERINRDALHLYNRICTNDFKNIDTHSEIQRSPLYLIHQSHDLTDIPTFIYLSKDIAQAICQSSAFLRAQGYKIKISESDRTQLSNPQLYTDSEPDYVAYLQNIVQYSSMFYENLSYFSTSISEFIDDNGFETLFKFPQINTLPTPPRKDS